MHPTYFYTVAILLTEFQLRSSDWLHGRSTAAHIRNTASDAAAAAELDTGKAP